MKYKIQMKTTQPKYLIANIKIPIQINQDGTNISLINHSTLHIESCDELPPDNGNQLLMIQESIQKYMNSLKKDDIQEPETQESAPQASAPQEHETQELDSLSIQPFKHGKNTTFRNYAKHNTHRFTSKKR